MRGNAMGEPVADPLARGRARGDFGGLVTLIGVLLALGASTTVRWFLFGLDTHRVAPLAIAAGVLSATGAVACYLPARRAARLDPQVALRLD